MFGTGLYESQSPDRRWRALRIEVDRGPNMPPLSLDDCEAVIFGASRAVQIWTNDGRLLTVPLERAFIEWAA